VGGVENVSAIEEILLDARFEGADSLGLQSGIGIGKWRPGERFLKTRFFESRGVRKTQTRTRKSFIATESPIGQSYPRHAGVAERAVVRKACSCDEREPT